ncbi:MAG: malonic semialdehyde reductase [Rhodobiaceae bacterium]|nr:malonic semialdehyde reductase [Rhodobiaceae bacterium]
MVSIEDIFINSKTCYKFQDKPVEDKTLHELYELTKWGATSFNSSPMRLKFLKSNDAKQKLSSLVSEDNVKKVIDAPVCAIIGMDTEFWKDLPKNYLREDAKKYFENDKIKSEITAFRNSSIQGGYFIKAASVLGLSTGPMSGFSNEGVDKEFFKGSSIKSNFLCRLGYAAEDGFFDRANRYSFDEIAEIL